MLLYWGCWIKNEGQTLQAEGNYFQSTKGMVLCTSDGIQCGGYNEKQAEARLLRSLNVQYVEEFLKQRY